MADWGADVVKVEAFAGDPARGFGKMLGGDLDDNPVFELDNRGKRSIVVDLSRPEGIELLLRLISDADVFVTNIRASALERLGLDPDTLTERFERLVYAINNERLKHYSASVQVIAEGEARCRLVWIIDILPNELAAYVQGQTKEAVAAIHRAFPSAVA